MKTRLASLLLVCAAVASAAPAARAPAPVDDFLYAIRVVESGNRYYNCPVGSHGEQGPYQFRREVWRQYTSAPFGDARTELADRVALLHYHWLAQELREGGMAPTPWTLAAAWNGGVEAVLSGHLTRATRRYAQRVTNLVASEGRLRAALTPKYRIVLARNN
ncbi:MAG: hypothetical protein ACREFX_05745 [Opitutaceae bacterium]